MLTQHKTNTLQQLNINVSYVNKTQESELKYVVHKQIIKYGYKWYNCR